MATHRDSISFGPLTNIIKAVGHVVGGVTGGVTTGATAVVTSTATGVGKAVGQVTDLPTDAIGAMIDGIASRIVAGMAASFGVAFLVNRLKVAPAIAGTLPPLAGGIAIGIVHLIESMAKAAKAPAPITPTR